MGHCIRLTCMGCNASLPCTPSSSEAVHLRQRLRLTSSYALLQVQSRFVEFTRAEWAQLRAATPLPLTEPQLRRLVSVNERMSLDEVADIYLPLSRLLNLYVGAMHNLHAASATFLGTDTPRVPFVIGIAGSVAVGKSTT